MTKIYNTNSGEIETYYESELGKAIAEHYEREKELLMEDRNFNVHTSLEEPKSSDENIREKTREREFKEIKDIALCRSFDMGKSYTKEARDKEIEDYKELVHLCNKYKDKYGIDISYLI